MSRIIDIDDPGLLDDLVAAPRAVLYKHSDRCWISMLAMDEVRTFVSDHPDTPVYQIDVIGDRAISQEAERRLGVPHASPQVLLLIEGEVVWYATHGSVRAKLLARADARHRVAS